MSENFSELIFDKNITHVVVVGNNEAAKIIDKIKIDTQLDGNEEEYLDNTNLLIGNYEYFLKFNLLIDKIYENILNKFFKGEIEKINKLLEESLNDELKKPSSERVTDDYYKNKLINVSIALHYNTDNPEFTNYKFIILIIRYLLHYVFQLYFFLYLQTIDINISEFFIKVEYGEKIVNLPENIIKNMNDNIDDTIIQTIMNDLEFVINNLYLESIKTPPFPIASQEKYKNIALVSLLLSEIPLEFELPIREHYPFSKNNNDDLILNNPNIFKEIKETNCIYQFKKYQLDLLNLYSRYIPKYNEYIDQYILFVILSQQKTNSIILTKSLILEICKIFDKIIMNNIIEKREELNKSYNYYLIKKKDLSIESNKLINDTNKLID